MTNPDEDLLTTSEGVDEGSADGTVEGAPETEEGTAAHGLVGRALREADRKDERSETSPAPPLDLGVDPPRGPGQQLEAGEG